MTERVIRDGKVAVLISPGFGAGWSTWADASHQEIALYHPRLVEAAEAGAVDIDAIVEELVGGDHFYTGGWRDIQIVWLPKETQFCVEEYDGSESIRTVEALTHTA